MTGNKYDKIYYISFLVFAFSLPLSRAAISFFIVFLPLVWVIEGQFRRKYEEIISNKSLLSIVVFLFISMIYGFFSDNIVLALDNLRMSLYWIVIFVIATSFKTEYLSRIITMFLFGMFISVVVSYGVFYELWTYNATLATNPSPFMIHIEYSVFLAFASLLILNRILFEKYLPKERLLLIMLFLLVIGNLFLIEGRTGQVAFLIGLMILSIMHFKFSVKSIFVGFILITSISMIAYSNSSAFEKMTDKTFNSVKNISNKNLDSSLGVRVSYWILTYDIVSKNIFGVGLGDYIDEVKNQLEEEKYPYLEEYRKTFLKKNHPHSQFLLIILQMGLIGALVFGVVIYNLFNIKIDNKNNRVVILFFSMFFISCLTEPLLLKQFTTAIFILFVGSFIGASKKEINYANKE